ncbi:solute carrier family 35 member G3-like [Latimeria chalumnae]|uniref:EamA domain-containing protein n=1 Tax=Latimeria chalumnae TaxID=7897 RepID=H3AX08_LATCH|nr:PREDICTED: solute carrier family 35 member G3-like [Latimeria chalumnae]|eukprot:XP_005997997.1 PREDICTED: solute carrier family 35 member G3-like [Latimeria chalumnae]
MFSKGFLLLKVLQRRHEPTQRTWSYEETIDTRPKSQERPLDLGLGTESGEASPPEQSKCRLSENMKGILIALFGGAIPSGFVAPFTRIAYQTSRMPSLEILFIRCCFHLSFAFFLRYKRISFFGPPKTWHRIFLHSFINIISIGCAYSSFMVMPTGNAATVRKGSSTICSTLLTLCLASDKLTGYDWLGLIGSTIGLLIIIVPDLLNLDKKTLMYDIFGYSLALLGGVALAIGLVIFRTFKHQSKLLMAAFNFGVVGSICCAPVMCLLQTPVLPQDLLTWCCVVTISILALISFLCANYAVIRTHPALVCALLHSEVVVTMIIQYFVLREQVSPFDIIGAGVIIGSIIVITVQNFSFEVERLGEVEK